MAQREKGDANQGCYDVCYELIRQASTGDRRRIGHFHLGSSPEVSRFNLILAHEALYTVHAIHFVVGFRQESQVCSADQHEEQTSQSNVSLFFFFFLALESDNTTQEYSAQDR